MQEQLRKAVAALIAKGMTMGDTGQFVVLSIDPQTDNSKHAYGPFGGPEATVVADQLRRNLDADDLSDVRVEVVPWMTWSG